ncbi:hypothetical protein F0U59_29845 [Archangium gephyra]|nr:hypothetical protein F0U59_29845 [Archangium gephyra]
MLLLFMLSVLGDGCNFPQEPLQPENPVQSDDGGLSANDDAGADGGSNEPADGGLSANDDAGADGGSNEPADGGQAEPADGGQAACTASWRGDRQYGTLQADETLSVWADEIGNVYTVGYENGLVGQTNIEPAGDSRAVVTKHGPDGRVSWHRILDTSGTDTAEHLIRASEGHLYVVGRTTGSFNGFINRGQFDVFVVELDAEGQSVHVMQSGDERPQHPSKLGLNAVGNLVIAGHDDLFVEHSQVMDSENGFIGSYDLLSAAQQWLWRSASLENPDRITGLAMNAPVSDAVYVSGFKFFGDKESLGGGFVRRYDLDGTQRWFTQIGFVATEVDELLVSPEGGLFAAGSTQLPSVGGQGQGLADAYVASLDPQTGVIRWVSKTGTPEHDLVSAFARGPTGDFYVAGDTFGAFPGYTNQGERDLFVLRFDSSGRLLSSWQQGTAERDHAAGLWVDSCNNVYLAGFTEGRLIGDSGPGGRDAFLMKVNMPSQAMPAFRVPIHRTTHPSTGKKGEALKGRER